MISFFKLLFKEDKKSILKTAYRSLVIFSVFQGLSISVCNFLFLKFNGLQAYEPYTIAIYLSFMLLSLGSGLVIFKGTKTGYAEGMEVSHAYPVLIP